MLDHKILVCSSIIFYPEVIERIYDLRIDSRAPAQGPLHGLRDLCSYVFPNIDIPRRIFEECVALRLWERMGWDVLDIL